MTQVIDMRGSTADERESILGAEFREVRVLGFKAIPPMRTIAMIEGRRVTLIGDPRESLRTYLGGRDDSEVMQ